MESESAQGGGSTSKPKPRTPKRREKGPKSPMEKPNHVLDYGSDEDTEEDSPSKPSRPKGKGKSPRKRRDSSPLLEEDIIEGFAFASFKFLDDLEVGTFFCNPPTKKYKNKIKPYTLY